MSLHDTEAALPDYEAEYNNRARVPEFQAIFAQWLAEGAAYRERWGGEIGLPYAPGERTRMDLFGDGQGPVAMFVHGGYWQSLGRESFSHLAGGSNAHGVTVAIPGYDLCPQVSMAEILRELREATAFVWRRFGKRIAVSGHSAGGHLAACLLATDWPAHAPDLPPGLVHSATCISGLFDLKPLVGTTINKALGMDEAEALRLSPAFWPAPRGLTLDAIVGGEESAEYWRQSRLIAERWGAEGVRTRCEMVEGANHFTVIAPLADPDSAMTKRFVALADEANLP
jgi:arylformamidase